MAHGPGFDYDPDSFQQLAKIRPTEAKLNPEFLRETEVKIIPENLPAFLANLEQHGAALVTPRRKLRDQGYRISESAVQDKKRVFELHRASFEQTGDENEIISRLFELLTGEAPAIGEELILVHRPARLEPRNVRIRRDGVGSSERIYLTVKARENGPTARVKRAAEENIELRPEWVKHVRELIKSLGYRRRQTREKYRTTYQLGPVYVETNEYPIPGVSPTVEFEGGEAEIYQTLDTLGIDHAAAKAWSDGDYYRELGIPSALRDRALFPKQPPSLIELHQQAEDEHA